MNNKVVVSGKIETNPTFSHQVLEEKFYEFLLKVPRLSGFCDQIPVTVSEKLLTDKIKVGNLVSISGQFRSYNKQEENKSRLVLTVFVKEFLPFDQNANPNYLEITGFVCKEPIYRTTPFKREICDLIIAVNRNFNKSDYLPCIAWGKNARYVKDWKVGDKVKILGRIQSRVYQKKIDNQIVEKIAYEISINKIEKVFEEKEILKVKVN